MSSGLNYTSVRLVLYQYRPVTVSALLSDSSSTLDSGEHV